MWVLGINICPDMSRMPYTLHYTLTVNSPSFLFTYSQRHANGTSSSSSTGNTGSGITAAKEKKEEEDTQAHVSALSEESLTTLLLELETAISTNTAMRKQGKHAGMYVFRYRCDICAVCAVCVAFTD